MYFFVVMSGRVVCEPLPRYIVWIRCQQGFAQFRAVLVHTAPAVHSVVQVAWSRCALAGCYRESNTNTEIHTRAVTALTFKGNNVIAFSNTSGGL